MKLKKLLITIPTCALVAIPAAISVSCSNPKSPTDTKVTVTSEFDYIDTTSTKGLQMTATVTTTSAEKGVTWSVDKTDIASIDENGILTGKGEGKKGVVIVTATAKDGSGAKATKQITILDKYTAITGFSWGGSRYSKTLALESYRMYQATVNVTSVSTVDLNAFYISKASAQEEGTYSFVWFNTFKTWAYDATKKAVIAPAGEEIPAGSTATANFRFYVTEDISDAWLFLGHFA